MKKVAVLGSTGSIGTQTLEVIRANSEKLNAFSLVAFSNDEKLQKQCAEFHPAFSALISRDGEDCLLRAVEGCDVAVVATRGITALKCVLYCLEHGIDVALANKETLVCAGQLVTSRVGKAKLIPVDSEHCAIAQCLQGRNSKDISKILLTASGGPFWKEKRFLHSVSAEEALKHPNWNMGAKITVDSATMMNKALEVVEAHWLFGVPTEKIQIVVHPQSVVHSMVEWSDGSVIAQLANPDMRLPIQFALLGGGKNLVESLNFSDLLTLTFQKCDYERFPCAKLGYEIENYPPLCATVMNAANDLCVESFLAGKMPFDEFYPTIMRTVENFACALSREPVTVESIAKCDRIARNYAQKLINGEIC